MINSRIESVRAARLQLIDLGDTKTAETLAWALEDETQERVTTDMRRRLWKGLHTGKIPAGPQEPVTLTDEPTVTHATIRDGGDELHIECRFSDGQKFAAITVDSEFPGLAQWIVAALVASQPAPVEANVLDLDKAFWEQLVQAATESSWIPQEYYFVNDWVSDCCNFLRTGDSTVAASVYSTTTPEQNAEVDAKLGIELLPPIRVSATTAGIMKRFAALEGVILQAFVREVLEQRFTAGGATVEAPKLTALQEDAANLLFALHDAWPYVHERCTIKAKKERISALMKKHGDFAECHDIKELNAAIAAASEPDCDVRRIMIDVVPGEDGMGREVYAKSNAQVVDLLTRLSERVEELEGRVKVVPEGFMLISDQQIVALEQAEIGMRAIAVKQRQVGDVIEPVRTINDAAKIAKVAADRVYNVIHCLDLNAAAPTPPN
jgi:hypothetical protein